MSQSTIRSCSAFPLVALLALGCTSDSSPSTGATGGASSTGGVSQSSTRGTGGTSGGGGTTGSSGTTASGGMSATGGRSAASGGAASGGAPSTGGKAGNTTASGGSTDTGGGSGSGGTAGTVAAAGGSASGGTLATGGNTGGTASNTGGTTSPPSDAGSDPVASAYSCNLVFGNSTTQQWFNGGFLTYPGIDATRWELRAVAHHYIGSWASSTDAGWTSSFDNSHACSSDAQNPERVIFIVTQSPPYATAAEYQKDITAIVNNIKSKYSKVKRIELTTLIRSPGNKETACSSKSGNEQSMPDAEDQGIAAVAADPAFTGLVVALPPFYVTACSDFNADAPQYTAAGATNIAKVYGAYWAANP